MKNWIAEAIGAAVVIALGLWTKFSFVNRSEVYNRDGRAKFAYQEDCEKLRLSCNATICQQIKALQDNQDKIWNRLDNKFDEVNRFMGQIQQYMDNNKK